MAAVSSAQTTTTTLTPPSSSHGHQNATSWGHDDQQEVRQCETSRPPVHMGRARHVPTHSIPLVFPWQSLRHSKRRGISLLTASSAERVRLPDRTARRLRHAKPYERIVYLWCSDGDSEDEICGQPLWRPLERVCRPQHPSTAAPAGDAE